MLNIIMSTVGLSFIISFVISSLYGLTREPSDVASVGFANTNRI